MGGRRHRGSDRDPIVADKLAGPGRPVYTAPHGEVDWPPEPVADAFFDHFVAALRRVRSLARGRETPVALERDPISGAQRDRVLGEISAENPASSMTFRETWMETV